MRMGWHRTFAVLLRIQRCIQQLGDLDVCRHADLDSIDDGMVKLKSPMAAVDGIVEVVDLVGSG